MAEYIERDAVLKKMQLACRIALIDGAPEDCDVDFSDDFAVAVDDIVEIPSADVVPVVHGRWVMKETMIRSLFAKNAYCSECLEETGYASNYCPNCGAHMKDGE